MIAYPEIDPILFSLGPFSMRWYGVMYMLAFVFAWALGHYRLRKLGGTFSTIMFDDAIFFGVLGVVLGGKVGYWLFYSPMTLFRDPLEVFKLWHPGMSFHGGLLGVMLALYYVSRKHKLSFLDLTDFIAPLVPSGLFFGRIGNFINGELWGRVTDSSWGMIFPLAGPDPRWPSQLIQATLEGLLLFTVVWWYSNKPRQRGQVSGCFLVVYSIARSVGEFFREPDAQYGYLAFDWLTMGQILCLPMAGLGVILMVKNWDKK